MLARRWMFLFAALLVPAAAEAVVKKVRVAVLEIRPLGTEPAKAELLSEVALTQAASLPGFDVIGRSDITSIIGFEKQKQVVGCTEDSSCLAEVGGALGVDYILVGSLGKMGTLYRIDIKLVETKRARVRSRLGVTVDGQEEKLVAAIEKAVRDLLLPETPRDEPPPPPPVVAQATPVERAPPPAEPARTTAAPKPSLAVAPPRDTAPTTAPVPPPPVEPESGKKSKALGWTAFTAVVVGIGAGGFAVYEGLQANTKYKSANDLLQPDGALLMSASVSDYKAYVSDGDSAKSMATISGGAAAGCVILGSVLGYISYRQTGEIGPFRF